MKLSILKNLISKEFWSSVLRRSLEILELKPISKKKQLSDFKIKKLKTLLWLDDLRDPTDSRMDWLAYSPIGREVEVVWLKDYYQFRNWIQQHGLPDGICFDHDLGEDTLTGYDCAKWLVDYCLDNQLLPPVWSSQSANPVGKANINRLLRNFIVRFQSEFS